VRKEQEGDLGHFFPLRKQKKKEIDQIKYKPDEKGKICKQIKEGANVGKSDKTTREQVHQGKVTGINHLEDHMIENGLSHGGKRCT